MNTDNNQRYKETEIHLASAMLDLMQKMPFDKITIKQICEQACVNRSTFYYHYASVYDMLDEIEKRLSNEMLEVVEEWENESEHQDLSPFIPYLHCIKKHCYFYQTTLANRRTLMPIQMTLKPLWDRLVLPQYEQANISDNDRQYYSAAFYGGITWTLCQWMSVDCATCEDKVADVLESCIPNIC